MVNFLALMSFSMPDGREEFTLDEFVAAFELERISLGGPVFDLEKLTWLNGRYLRRLSTEEMIGRLRAHLLSDAYLSQVIPLCRERVDTLEGFFDYASFFFTGEVAYDEAARAAMVPKERTPAAVGKVLAALVEKAVDPQLEWTAETVEAALRSFAEAEGWAPKELYMTVRAGRHRPLGHAAPVRDPGRAGQGGHPPPPAQGRGDAAMSDDKPSDFIREIVAEDVRSGQAPLSGHALPARAQRLPAHRPRQVHLPQLRHRAGVRRAHAPALRRHQPHQGGAGVRRRHQGRRALAGLRLGPRTSTTPPTTSSSSTTGRSS